MPAIRYLVPYEVAVFALDAGSGKHITNLFYLKTRVQTAAPPAYGAPIAGASSVATMLASFQTGWDTNIVPLLNANYKSQSMTARAILGKRYATPLLAITSVIPGANTQITTGLPHGFSTGQVVSVTGITTPTGLNAQFTITKIDANNFTLNGGLSAGAWSGDGQVQRVQGPLQFVYDDVVTTPDATVGGIVGDALPLYCTASVRRISTGAGRHFRSRNSFSPMSEADSVDGGWVAGTKTAWATALGNMVLPANNGGSDAGSKLMDLQALSKQLSFALPSPFTQSDTWTRPVLSMVLQRNSGSLVRRKPRLTSVIT